jgi:antibiotic biosynthesis monooxygenase (ABM) superfamily enzyme
MNEIGSYLEETPRVETVCGLEGWFSEPGAAFKQVPTKWKMAVLTWIGVCSTVYSVTLISTPFTENWPWILKFFAVNAGVVALLFWLVMPVLSHLFRAWLVPKQSKRA